jgi:DNA-binding transcriptional regulator YhcF (GntR family)
VDSRADTHQRNMPKYARLAATVRAQIEDGMLLPGEPVPSGAALSRVTGYSDVTCRRALRVLIQDGVLVSGASPGARLRVPLRDPTPGDQSLADAARALSASLSARRRAAGLTQAQLAEIVGKSVTSIGHAETGRVWQSRLFWERADKGVNADGELLALHDAYRAATIASDPAAVAVKTAIGDPSDDPETVAASTSNAETIALSVPERVSRVTISWADGAVTDVYPPSAAFPTALALLGSPDEGHRLGRAAGGYRHRAVLGRVQLPGDLQDYQPAARPGSGNPPRGWRG